MTPMFGVMTHLFIFIDRQGTATIKYHRAATTLIDIGAMTPASWRDDTSGNG
jgi:hypothetical protein